MKARNILFSALSAKVYNSISHHKCVQTMWNALQVLTKELETSKLIEEYELFRIKLREFVEFMQTRFLHLISKLNNLRKTFSNKDCANKILRFMSREWQPNITTIKESNNLSSFDSIKLFEKLTKHESKLKLHDESEVKSKKKEKVKKKSGDLFLKA